MKSFQITNLKDERRALTQVCSDSVYFFVLEKYAEETGFKQGESKGRAP